jgi:hypothetical protein
MGWVGWLLYWCAGAVALALLFVFDDATVKAFISKVGFEAVVLIASGYFILPVVWQNMRDT